jgi:hypothetical protein
MSIKEKEILAGLVLLLLGALLLKNPRCNRGCKTVGEHIVSHGLDDLLAGFLA